MSIRGPGLSTGSENDRNVDKLAGSGLLELMMVLNAAAVLLIVLGWPEMGHKLAAPMEWALGATGPGRLDLTAYPYSALWMIPGSSCLVAVFAIKHGFWLLARFACFGPALLLGLTFAWFYLLPPGFH